jgi:CHAT domain-containing protein
VVVSYAVLPHEVLIWTVSRNRFKMQRIPLKSVELELMVTELRRSIGDPSGESGPGASSERLYELLIAQIGDLEPEASLILIPDKWLHYVPFAALRNGGTRRFLVQDHELTYVPSTALLLESLARRHERGVSKHSSRVLAVGNPKFDANFFPLANLPASEREAREIAAVYRKGGTLIGAKATDVSLRSVAPMLDVLHFAGHAVVRTDAPQMSHLVLASEGGSGGAVFSRDIARWHLGQMKLVVLSGCNTASGRISATEGASSLARAFFAAGVPAVIASLWALDDEKTADFFVAFHRRFGDGEQAATALRKTQLEWIAHAESASTWAAFQFFGS